MSPHAMLRGGAWRGLGLALVFLAACTPPSAATDAGAGADADDAIDAGADAPAALSAEAGPAIFAYVGDEVVLDASASTGASEYEWWPGDGRRLPAASDPVVRVTYDAPGRYRADLIVYDGAGARRTDVTTVTITRAPVFSPRESSSVTVLDAVDATSGARLVAVVGPDDDALALVPSDDALGLAGAARRIPVCDHPRSVASLDEMHALVSCPDADALVLVELAGGTTSRLDLRYGARPFGIVPLASGRAAVALSGTGELLIVELAAGALSVTATWPAITDARALALLPDGRLVMPRWRSPDTGGELVVIDPETGDRTSIALAVDPQIASDTEVGGVPSYLGSVAVSPDGTLIAVAGLQAAIDEGVYRSGRPLTFQTALRATIAFVDVATLTELFERRRQLDNRGFASAVTFSPEGDFLFIATRGNRALERYDVLRDVMAGTVQDVGYALEGVASAGRFLYVDAFLSRELVAFDAGGLLDLTETARVGRVEVEPLAPEVLRGARLFSDSADERLGRDGYMACAHCHLDGLDDHRVWDFTDRGEGLRNTIELRGRAGEAPIHWSANFDEVQDFENDIRNAFLGTGLLADADWATHATTLGDAKAGLSEDLDALAAYVVSLDTFVRSPYRDPDGALSATALRGRAIFERVDVGCASCHAGARLTDSGFAAPGVPRLHDVGTLGPGSGGRLGGTLEGIDTPTLRGIFGTAPYLHDGSAATLREVLVDRNPRDQHGVTSILSAAEIDDLVAYLLCLDDTIDP